MMQASREPSTSRNVAEMDRTSKCHPWRTHAEAEAHYLIEKELALRLMRSVREERVNLYAAVYDELFRRVPYHPMLIAEANPDERKREILYLMKLIRSYVGPQATYLEIGAGDCALAVEVARRAGRVYAIDVSSAPSRNVKFPSNLTFVVSDGLSVPVPSESVDLAFSNQLIEHLHPDDALEETRDICRTLVNGGKYICMTPHRFTGPHDVSRFFDEEATGFHLKEYSVRHLSQLLVSAGFASVSLIVFAKGYNAEVPVAPVAGLERLLGLLPYRLRKQIAGVPGLSAVFDRLIMVGTK
jgi:SAM-dependent methyltransferase